MQRTQRTLFHFEFILFWLEPDYIFIDLNYPIFFYFPISLSHIKENIKETIFCCLAIILIKVFSKKKNFFAEYHHYINIFIYLFNLLAYFQIILHAKIFHMTIFMILTLSLLGYLKTRIRWGGQFDPPPLNPMFDVQI